MPDQQTVEVGQVWESRDYRDHGRRVRVVEVDDRTQIAIIQRLVRSHIRYETLRKRYRLVQEALSEEA